jgi:hypothetical protein
MKKIILSVNDNLTYLYFLPLTCWAWRYFGWEPVIFYCGKMDTAERIIPDFRTYNIRECLVYEPHKSATIAQVARLYGACVADGMLMTGDIDMLPLSDYWKPNPLKINCYGRDLTDYHYPICYIAMDARNWMRVMDIKNSLYGVHLRRDLRVQTNQWVLDQDIVTERLLGFRSEIQEWDRGTDKKTGYPVGRVERSNWTLDHKEFIDCHMPHDMLKNTASVIKVKKLLKLIWPDQDWAWFDAYHDKFRKQWLSAR